MAGAVRESFDHLLVELRLGLIAARDLRTPLLAKAIVLAGLGACLVHLDFLPDHTHALRYVEDALITTAGLLAAIRLIPDYLLREFKSSIGAGQAASLRCMEQRRGNSLQQMPASVRGQYDEAQRQRTANVICIKWGDRYGAEWVNRLYGMVVRNTSWKIRFVCFTDDPTGIRKEVECRPLPAGTLDMLAAAGKQWRKLSLMEKGLGDLTGMTLFLDLDLLVVGSLDDLFTCPGRFLITREWKHPELGYGNSSVFRFFIGEESYVLDKFRATPADDLKHIYGDKEQNFLSKAVEQVEFWPSAWCLPFSGGCAPRNRVLRYLSTPVRPTGARIVVFFGSITPRSAMLGRHEPGKRGVRPRKLRLTERRFRPAEWIGEVWRE